MGQIDATQPRMVDAEDYGQEPEQETDIGDDDQPVDIKAKLVEQIDNINLARDIDKQTLDTIGSLVVREFTVDDNSRAEWKDEAQKALDFATQKSIEKQYPWPKASSIVFPLITSAALQFAARTYPAIIQNRNVVKGTVWGSDKGEPVLGPDKKPIPNPANPQEPLWLSAPGEKRLRADRIGDHMSYQLLEEMPEWEPQTDSLLNQIPIIGGAARKTYRDPSEDRNYSLLVSLMNLTWNYYAKSFEKAPRHTETLTLYPIEIEENERADEMFIPISYSAGTDVEGAEEQDDEAPHTFLEQHRTYDLDGDGYPEPYIVTVHKRSSQVVRIVARYDEDGIHTDEEGNITRIVPVDHYTLFPFLPDPKGGSYPVGFGHLLRPINEAINTTLNQMFDAGHLQNAGGGFIGEDLGIASGPVNFQVGKFVRVKTKGQAIRDSVFPIPFNGPSTVLFQLLGLLISSGKEVASIQDILAGDASLANSQPTTLLALIEQGSKVYTSIHKRIYRALKGELAKLYRLNRLYLKDDQRYKVGDEWREVSPDDYRLGGGVEPIADPTMVTDMQRMGRAMVVMQFKDDPLINQIEIRRRVLDAAQIDRIDELLITQPPPNPMMELEMETKQAELGRIRAAELKDQSQAYLNFAMARAKADEAEMEWIGHQLDISRLHIEALNTSVKAADVEVKAHSHNLKANMQDTKNAAQRESKRQPVSVPDQGGISAMAAPSGDQGVPPIPNGPADQLAGGGDGAMGGGALGLG